MNTVYMINEREYSSIQLPVFPTYNWFMEQIKIIYRQDKAREITIFIGKKYAMEKVKIPDNLHIASQSFLAYDWFLKWQQYVEQQESKQTIAFLLDQILIFTNFYNFVAKQKTNDMICFQQNNNENFAN